MGDRDDGCLKCGMSGAQIVAEDRRDIDGGFVCSVGRMVAGSDGLPVGLP